MILFILLKIFQTNINTIGIKSRLMLNFNDIFFGVATEIGFLFGLK